MEDLTKEQWKRVFEVMQKEARHQKSIVESNLRKGLISASRMEALQLAKEIGEIALRNADKKR